MDVVVGMFSHLLFPSQRSMNGHFKFVDEDHVVSLKTPAQCKQLFLKCIWSFLSEHLVLQC